MRLRPSSSLILLGIGVVMIVAGIRGAGLDATVEALRAGKLPPGR